MVVRTALDDVYREIDIIRNLNHPHVLKVYEILDSEVCNKLYLSNPYLVQEYCEKGALLEWDAGTHRFKCPWETTPLNENLLKSIIHQLAFGINYIHNCQILHCDIKPQNVLVNKDFIIKLADFGQAMHCEANDFINKTHGTYQFMSPESVAGIIHLAQGSFSGKAADIWAFGVTIYCFIYRVLPYDGANLNDLMQNIENTT